MCLVFFTSRINTVNVLCFVLILYLSLVSRKGGRVGLYQDVKLVHPMHLKLMIWSKQTLFYNILYTVYMDIYSNIYIYIFISDLHVSFANSLFLFSLLGLNLLSLSISLHYDTTYIFFL